MMRHVLYKAMIVGGSAAKCGLNSEKNDVPFHVQKVKGNRRRDRTLKLEDLKEHGIELT